MTVILFEIVRGDWALFWPMRAIFEHGLHLRAGSQWHKEPSDGIESSMESESQESERFFFLPIPLLIPSLANKCELVDRNRKRKQKNQPITKLIPNPFTRDLERKVW